MRKKQMIKKIAILLVVVGIVYYFLPMPLSRNMKTDYSYAVSVVHIGLGTMDHDDYEDIDSGQVEELVALADQYYYMRTFRTYFSNGINNLGDEEVQIAVWDGRDFSRMLVMTSSGKMMIDSHSYILFRGKDFVSKVESIFTE